MMSSEQELQMYKQSSPKQDNVLVLSRGIKRLEELLLLGAFLDDSDNEISLNGLYAPEDRVDMISGISLLDVVTKLGE